MANKALKTALFDVRQAKTWTERLYYVSPILEAAAKTVHGSLGRPTRHAAEANSAWSGHITGLNERAIHVLGLGDCETTIIQGGCFRGLLYPLVSRGSLLGPKILGTYESEIAGWIEDIAEADVDRVIDIGSAEGYYAVGLASKLPGAIVHAFDVDEEARRLTTELAALNGVSDRVMVDGFCDPARLAGLIKAAKRPVVFVDIEGYENELLDPSETPELARAEIIVELHEQLRPGVTTRLLERFVHSHCIDLACTRSDAANIEAAVAQGLSRDVAATAVPEGRRLPQLWLRLCPLPTN